jgi:hypothetical protein
MKLNQDLDSMPKDQTYSVFLDSDSSASSNGQFFVPTRSRLIGLAPKGLGTPQVESLFSYLLRLAEAHAVRFVDLIQHVIGPMVYGEHVRKLRFRMCERYRRGISVEEIAAIEELTRLSGLRVLTLGPVKNLQCVHVDYAKKRSWCPICIAEDPEPYERLIWQVKGVTHCPEHGILLENTCVHCGSFQDYSRTRVHLRKCDKCGGDRISQTASSEEPDEAGIWRSQESARFLAWAAAYRPGPKSPFDNFRANIRTFSKIAGGWSPLGRVMGVPSTCFITWKKGLGTPELEKVLSLAWCASVSAADCFARELDAPEVRIREFHPSIRKPRAYKKRRSMPDIDVLLGILDRRIKEHPLEAVVLKTVMEELGVCAKHVISNNAVFRRRFGQHNARIRRLRRRAAVWRLAIEIREVILEAKNAGREAVLSGPRIYGDQTNRFVPGSGPQMFRRMIRLSEGGMPLPDPASRVPADVSAVWELDASKKQF